MVVLAAATVIAGCSQTCSFPCSLLVCFVLWNPGPGATLYWPELQKAHPLVLTETTLDRILDIFTSRGSLHFAESFLTIFGSAKINSKVSRLWWTSIEQEKKNMQTPRKYRNQVIFKCFQICGLNCPRFVCWTKIYKCTIDIMNKKGSMLGNRKLLTHMEHLHHARPHANLFTDINMCGQLCNFMGSAIIMPILGMRELIWGVHKIDLNIIVDNR